MQKNIWHIIPENDIDNHKQISEAQQIVDNDGVFGTQIISECKCEPTIIYENDSIIIVHEAFDKRANPYFQKEEEVIEKQEIKIGVLNTNYGIKGFITALPGCPVYDDGNRYVIYLEPEISGVIKRVPFYKDTLKDWIDFYGQ